MNIYRELMTLYIYAESRALQNQELEQKAFSACSYVSRVNVSFLSRLYRGPLAIIHQDPRALQH